MQELLCSFFGNKIKNEELELSDGLKEEFEIAVKQNVLVIPIGCTGYMSKELWEMVINNFEDYYPDDKEIKEILQSLGSCTDNDDELVGKIIKIINLLQNIN